jgi:hypothetical protein
LEVAFEEGAGVLEVGFGVGFGGGETRKRFVQDADDALLLGEGWEREIKSKHLVHLRPWHSRTGACRVYPFARFVREQPV